MATSTPTPTPLDYEEDFDRRCLPFTGARPSTRNGLELPRIVEGAVNFIYSTVTQSTLASGIGNVKRSRVSFYLLFRLDPLSTLRLFTRLPWSRVFFGFSLRELRKGFPKAVAQLPIAYALPERYLTSAGPMRSHMRGGYASIPYRLDPFLRLLDALRGFCFCRCKGARILANS